MMATAPIAPNMSFFLLSHLGLGVSGVSGVSGVVLIMVLMGLSLSWCRSVPGGPIGNPT